MDEIGSLPEQNLGDFVFEPDAQSLQRILENRAISPNSLGYGKQKEIPTKNFTGLTPAKNLPTSLRKQQDKYEYFEGKNGAIIYRERKKHTSGGSDSNRKNPNGPTSGRKIFGRANAVTALGNREKLKGVLPKRLAKAPELPSSFDVLSKNNESSNELSAINDATKNNGKPSILKNTLCRSEKRIIPLSLPLPRQSISERKAIPQLDNMSSLIPRPKTLRPIHARKELNFNEGFQAPIITKKLGSDQSKDSACNKSFEFVRPLELKPNNVPNRADFISSNDAKEQKEHNSIAKMIMMRESLVGLPKESIGGLFRQSLSLAELDRLFEDDSTQSFESLETRLKTPKRKVMKKSSDSIHDADALGEGKTVTVPKITVSSDDMTGDTPSDKYDKLDSSQPTVDIQKPTDDIEVTDKLDNCEIEREETISTSQVEEFNNQTIVEIYEIEYSDDDDFDPNDTVDISSILQRSLSLNDLTSLSTTNFQVEIENGITDQLVASSRSISDTNLSKCILEPEQPVCTEEDVHLMANGSDEEDEFLRKAGEDLEMYQEQQAQIDRMFAELILKSQRRREEFKSVWGVSPRCINKKRTVKTVINVPKVAFSPRPEEFDNDENSDIDDNLLSTEDMFGKTDDKTSNFDEKENALEKPIPDDLFELYLDANFSRQNAETTQNFNDIQDANLNTPNLDDIVPSFQIDDFLKDLNAKSLEHNDASPKTYTCQKNYSEIDNQDNLESQDCIGEAEMDIECERPQLTEVIETDISFENNKKCGLHTTSRHDYKESQSDGNNSLAEQEEIQCNDTQNKTQKSVRFVDVTPIVDTQESYLPLETEGPSSEPKNRVVKHKHKRRSIQVQIPVHFQSGSRGNISFNEAGFCTNQGTKLKDKETINVGLLKTPVNYRLINKNQSEASENISPVANSKELTVLNMTTPMALRDISNRAQRELATLYSPCSEEEECSSDNLTTYASN